MLGWMSGLLRLFGLHKVSRIQAAEWTRQVPQEEPYPIPQPTRQPSRPLTVLRPGDFAREHRVAISQALLDLSISESESKINEGIEDIPTRPPVSTLIEAGAVPVASSWPARDQAREAIFADVAVQGPIVLAEDDDPTAISETTRQRRFARAIQSLCE
jgi:hypothetical protein